MIEKEKKRCQQRYIVDFGCRFSFRMLYDDDDDFLFFLIIISLVWYDRNLAIIYGKIIWNQKKGKWFFCFGFDFVFVQLKKKQTNKQTNKNLKSYSTLRIELIDFEFFFQYSLYSVYVLSESLNIWKKIKHFWIRRQAIYIGHLRECLDWNFF